MASTSIQEQDSSVIPTSLFLLSSLLLVSAASENNSVLAKDKEGEGEEGKERVGDVGVGNVGNVGEGEGDAGEKGQKPRVTFGPSSSTGPYPVQGPSTGQGPSPSRGQSPEEDEYSKLIVAITQQYMRTYNYISLELRSLDTIFKHNVNNPTKLNYHLQDFGININEATNICINFTSKKKAINIKAKYTERLTTKLEKLMNLHDQTSILKTIDEDIDTITNIDELNALLEPYAIRLSSNEICIKRNTGEDEANEAAANEEDDKAEALAAVEAAIEVETEEAQTAEEVANEADERVKAEQAKAERAKADEQAKAEQARLANEAAERAKANEAEEAARTIQRRIRRRTSTHKLGSPLRKALSANPRNPR